MTSDSADDKRGREEDQDGKREKDEVLRIGFATKADDPGMAGHRRSSAGIACRLRLWPP
jgi:hypothetical protein